MGESQSSWTTVYKGESDSLCHCRDCQEPDHTNSGFPGKGFRLYFKCNSMELTNSIHTFKDTSVVSC